MAMTTKLQLEVDTTQLDEALQKMDRLMAKGRQAEQQGLLPVVAGAALATAARAPVSRRQLLGGRWLFGHR
jgi:hypothetical protein